jgi:hypothetical protein
MNDTFDGNVYVCPIAPDGMAEDEWQDGYRDAMFHYARDHVSELKGAVFLSFDRVDFPYAYGYRQAVRDIMDHQEA